MILKPGKCSYRVTVKIGRLIAATIIDPVSTDTWHLTLTSLQCLIAERQKDTSFGRPPIRQKPTIFAPNGYIVELWPPPDMPYECRISFYPPAKEI